MFLITLRYISKAWALLMSRLLPLTKVLETS